MKTSLPRLAALFAASVVLLTPLATAADWYVDAVNGSNANTGTSPTNAWRTLTHALAQTQSAPDETIHVAAGVYNAALGELFPLGIDAGQRVVGVDRDSVVIDAFDAVFALAFVDPIAGGVIPPTSGLERLTVRRGSTGIVVSCSNGVVSPTIRDVLIEQAQDSGLWISISSSQLSTPTLERVVVRDSGGGLGIQAQQPQTLLVRVRECAFVENDQVGVVAGSAAQGTFERCRFSNNGVDGVRSFPGARFLSFTDCEISGNGGTGLRFDSPTSMTSVFELLRCTVANNQDFGLELTGPNLNAPATIQDSIFANVSADFSALAANSPMLSVSHSLIRGGQFTGANGNVSDDPLFRDEAAGDYRLKWSSPGIDVASAQAAPGTLDLNGVARDIDGNLDALRRADLGAFEFQPLEIQSSGAIGTPLQLSLSGPLLANATIYWTRVGLSAPLPTLFGEFELDPLFARPFRTLQAPGVVTRMIPNNPALVGHSFAFQALVDSPIAPLSKAFTNGVEVLITP